MNNKSAPDSKSKKWVNPSKNLVDKAIAKWTASRSRADNTSVVTLMIDPPGPPPRTKGTKLDNHKTNKHCHEGLGAGDMSPCDADDCIDEDESKLPESGGMAIFTRLPDELDQEPSTSTPNSHSISLNSNVMSKIRPCSHHSTKEGYSHNQQKPMSTSTTPCNASTTSRCSDFRFSTLKPISHFENDISSAISDSQVSTTSPSPTPSRSHSSSPSSTPSASKRKRFRLDEKRSSLPLNMMRPEESSGNSDTENERVSYSPEPSSLSPNNSKLNIKKQKVDLEKKHLHSSSLQHHNPPSISSNTASSSSSSTPNVVQNTRTLRSDTLASIPIKTLRSRNVNMSSNVNNTSSTSPSIYNHNNQQYCHQRRQSAAVAQPSSTTANNNNNNSNNKKWSQRR